MKNQILVGTIAQGGTFELDHYMDEARVALRAMADESEQAAEHLTALRKRARGRHSDPHGTHDYRDRDVRNLRRRAKLSIGVAEHLRAMAEDPEALRLLADVEGISKVVFTADDVIRHELVGRIVAAYDRAGRRKAATRERGGE